MQIRERAGVKYAVAKRLTSVSIGLASLSLLAACSTPSTRTSPMRSLGYEATDTSTETTTQSQNNIDTRPSQSDLFRATGNGRFLDTQRASQAYTATGPDGITLAFENAPIAEIASAVLGDILGAQYVIDPQVSGNVTLRSARPVAPSDIPAALDRALQLSNFRLVETSDGTYFITQRNRAREFTSGPRLVGEGLPPGFGHVIVPLEYVPVEEMRRLLQPFTSNGGTVSLADAQRQILILSGDPSQLEVMLETIALFDVDWLSEMSFALFQLDHTDPVDLIDELTTLFGGPDGPIGSQLEFVPLPRLNAVVAIAQRSFRIEQAGAWIERLDVRVDRGRRVRVLQLMNADAERLAERLSSLFSDGDGASNITIDADPDANALLIIADEETFSAIAEAAASLDEAPDQVLIEAMIAEVVLNDDLRYGVQWFLDTRDGGRATSTDNSGGGVGARFPGFAYTYNSDYVRVALSAIASVTDVEIISSPQIMTLDNQSASLQVGDQVPVVTQSAVSISDPNAPIVNSVQFRDTGVVLNVTPRISANGMVQLQVSQEVSSVAETTTSGIDSPTIQQRQFESTVSVRDGQTVALGGLISSTRTLSQSGVPYLQDMPVLGNLFRDRTDTVRRTELIIFLTPRVIRSNEDAAEATRAMRARLERLQLSGFGDDEAN